uniref:Propionyl-CoA carboxylase n=1 Tax=uncultured organism TaxID=155900 RepID=E3T2Z3_9ZZZZ|nr:propionyl-CoA carboxylase [uncultured organism]
MTPKTCLRIWRDAAPKLTFDIKNSNLEVFLNASEELPKFDPAVVIDIKFDEVSFQLFFEEKFIEELFLIASLKISFEQMKEQDAAVVFEHLFTKILKKLENKLGGNISIVGVRKISNSTLENGLGFSVNFKDNDFDGIFECSDEGFLEKIANLLLPFQVAGEKTCPSLSDVIIGPVEISKDELDKIQVGISTINLA